MEELGLPFKGAQLLGILSKDSFNDEVNDRKQKLNIFEVKALIQERNPQLDREIYELDSFGRSASLGQVHRATLKSGDRVAIKLQYSGVRDEIEGQLELLLQAAALSSERKFSFDIGIYQRELRKLFLSETDYLQEAKNQTGAANRLGLTSMP
jgi:predicted unusual protein kinase regulating ubiquinone biosynthesis (AarF/ABC1/UbiB family)